MHGAVYGNKTRYAGPKKIQQFWTPPLTPSVRFWYKHFEESSTVLHKRGAGHSCVSDETIERIRRFFFFFSEFILCYEKKISTCILLSFKSCTQLFDMIDLQVNNLHYALESGSRNRIPKKSCVL